jgi:hypothetical protein
LQLDLEIRAARSTGILLLCGFNASTTSLPDWPMDKVEPCSRRSGAVRNGSKRLLQLCSKLSLHICNGRGDGYNAGAPTSFGVSDRNKAVVDYALVPAHLVPLAALNVLHNAASDHAAMLLHSSAPQLAGQPGNGGRHAALRHRHRRRQHLLQCLQRQALRARRPCCLGQQRTHSGSASTVTASAPQLLPPAWHPTTGWKRSKRGQLQP